MAVNKPIGDNARKWAVRNRQQVYNSKVNRWIKRWPDWRFMDQKQDWTPFKWVRKEK